MAANVWPVDHVIKGTEWQQFLEYSRPLYARKAVAEYRISDTTLQNDRDLHIEVSAGGVYKFVTFLKFTSPTGADIRWAWNGPQGSVYYHMGSLGSTETVLYGNTDWSFAVGSYQVPGTVTASNAVFSPAGQIEAIESGRMYFQWCQNVSTASNSILEAGSALIAWRIA